MNTITKYQAYDGTEFREPDACLAYETNCRAADDIVSRLPERPEDLDFSNGGGYIQHDPAVWHSVRRDLLIQANKECPLAWFTQSLENTDADPGGAARGIDECCTKRLRDAWHRIWCTDKTYREWGQPYYALNPGKGTQKRLNP